MAKIKIEEIINHLGYEFKKVLSKTIKQEFPDVKFDEIALFNKFKSNVSVELKKWENIPDNLVEKSDY